VSLYPHLDDVNVFLIAANAGGFSAAAEQLNASPAFVSKRIGVLEKFLGVKLFLRSARGVTLTLEGKIAIDWSNKLLETIGQMTTAIHKEQETPQGRLRVVSSTGFGGSCIAPMISEIMRCYPELTLDLELLDRPVDLISEGFDLDVRVGGELPLNMIAKRLMRNRRILCASPHYIKHYGFPLKTQELESHRCIGIRERDHTYNIWRLQCGDNTTTVKLIEGLMTNNGSVAKEWCLNGHGIMLRSAWDLKSELASGALINILPDYYEQADVYAIYGSRLETSAKMRVCVNYFDQHLSSMVNNMN